MNIIDTTRRKKKKKKKKKERKKKKTKVDLGVQSNFEIWRGGSFGMREKTSSHEI